MTITHEASTGVAVGSSNQGSVSTAVTYVGVASGRRGILVASIKPTTNTWDVVSGWTLLANVAGGTGTELGTDNAPTRLGVWERPFDGTEGASVLVGNTGGGAGNVIAGAMTSYSTDASGWDTSIFVSGDDNTHAANPSATFGAWASALQPGDLVVIAQAGDTDNAGVKSNPILAQTGATFGTVNYRNNSLSSTGSDASVMTWDATVLTGSANAPSFSYTYATSSCGPFVALRLREIVAVGARERWGLPL